MLNVDADVLALSLDDLRRYAMDQRRSLHYWKSYAARVQGMTIDQLETKFRAAAAEINAGPAVVHTNEFPASAGLVSDEIS